MSLGRAPKGTYRNPAEKHCWETCQACFRCDAKGEYAKCNGCSGRFDTYGVTVPHPDDFCDCKNGVLNFVRYDGQRVQVKYKTNPFKGEVLMNQKTEDEADYDAYLNDLREKYDDPNLNPVQVTEE